MLQCYNMRFGYVLPSLGILAAILLFLLFLSTACSLLASEDILVLPLDLRDLSSHKAATDQVLKTFGKV